MKLSNGEIMGILHADDEFIDKEIISNNCTKIFRWKFRYTFF